ncbi:unnamed protein product [Echinostoma caproni]|uniref:BPL/LPL catalytic domain-containing protein n=1 Tax=Echinostoma caproni TaxID=27848 RepID=A0A183AU02_9TREM|nr:unnamed protein product [Echinostoma caproni]
MLPYYQASVIASAEEALLTAFSWWRFGFESWQTSARLLVLIEDKNACTDDQKLFNSELDLVAKFIADGGRVVVLLDPPSKSPSENRIGLETSLFNLVTTESEIAPLDTSHCDAPWQWSVQSPVKPFEQESSREIVPARALIGSVPNGSGPSVRFVAILADCVDGNWHLLLEALRLLGISCHNPDDTGVQNSSTDHVVLHYLIGLEGREADSNGKISPNVIQSKLALEDVKSGTQYDLRTVHLSDPSIPTEFPWTVYTSALRTRVLGHTLLWAESLPSSYCLGERLLAKLPADSGLMIVSNRQTEGKGRGSNRWISLVGQAAFTFHMTLRKPMGFQQHESGPPFPFMNLVTCVQHLVALAIVLAGRRILAGRLGLVTNEGKEPDPESLALFSLPSALYPNEQPKDSKQIRRTKVRGQ